MRQHFKLPFLILNLFILLMTIASVLIIAFCAKEYTVKASVDLPENATDIEYTITNGNVTVSDIRISDGECLLTVKPVSVGNDIIFIRPKSAESGEVVREEDFVFYAGSFDTIFSLKGDLDFQGSFFVTILMLITAIVVMAALCHAFFHYLKSALFSYAMVACGGVALFHFMCLTTVLLTLAVNSSDFSDIPIGRYFSLFVSSGNIFILWLAPFMSLFCIALAVSNITLIYHEGFGFVNLLGIFLSLLWFTGYLLFCFFENNASGSELHGKVFTSFSNGISVLLSYLVCMLFSTVLSAFLASRNKPPYDRDYVIILGCAIRKDGSPTPILRSRIDAALRFAKEQLEKTGKHLKFVPSGGQGSDEVISEAESMRRYLREKDIADTQILPESKSVNTLQNIRYSKKIIESDAPGEYTAAFATTNYHVFRGYILCKKQGLKNARGISAKTKWYFFPNAFLREFVGLIVDEWKKHFLVIMMLVLFFVAVNLLSF